MSSNGWIGTETTLTTAEPPLARFYRISVLGLEDLDFQHYDVLGMAFERHVGRKVAELLATIYHTPVILEPI